MATAVFLELYASIQSNPSSQQGHERLWEQEVLRACASKVVRGFFGAAGVSGFAAWFASKRLKFVPRLCISASCSLIGGKMYGSWSMASSVEQILGFEGKRIQLELANIILRRHQDDSAMVQLVKRHFYAEQVFKDLNPDRIFYQWRPRNLYVDGDNTKRVQVNESVETKVAEPADDTQVVAESANGSAQPSQIMLEELCCDPAECVLGYSGSGAEDGSQQLGDGKTSPASVRARRRARHRRHQQQATTYDVDAGMI